MTERPFIDLIMMEEDQPGTSHVQEVTPDVGVQDPRETDLEVELNKQMQNEIDEIVKECMQWEKDIIHSATLALTSDYHMPTLPYPLLKQEVFMIKKQYLPQCPIDQLGGYNTIRLEDWEVLNIMDNHPRWWIRWFKLRPKDQIFYLNAP